MNNKFKHIVIGSGAGGSVVSLELSKKGENVALVEEGEKFDNSFFKKNNIATRTKSLWRNNGLTPMLGSPPIAYVEGVALGGTTVSNGGVLERIAPEILDNFFIHYNISGYSHDELKQIYEKIEKKLFVKKYLEPKNNYDSTNIINVLKKKNISYKLSNLAHNNCENSNQCISGCPTGAKMSNLSLTYIPEALNNGLNLFTGSKVVKIFRRNGIYTLKIIKNKKILNLYCEKLYISAGPIQTPFIILKNGLHKSAGKMINFHLNYKIGAFFGEKINARKGTIHIMNIDHHAREGFSMVPANFQKSYFFSSFPNFSNKKINYIEKEIDNYAMYTVQIKVKGYARIVSHKTPDPVVYYKLKNDDVNKIKKSLKTFSKLLFDCGAKKIFFSYDNDHSLENLKDVENFISVFNYKKMSYVCAHAMSSCKMSNNSDGIVDDNGFLKNNHNIIVADNSILPESIGDSPQLTTMAFVHQIMKKQLN